VAWLALPRLAFGGFMKLHRFYIGLQDDEGNTYSCKRVMEIANQYFAGFTLIETLGYWQGKAEKSCMVEVLETNVIYEGVLTQFVRHIKGELNQKTVLYYNQEVGGLK
jgi:hypothetical protein